MFKTMQHSGKWFAAIAGLAGILVMTAASSGAGARDGVTPLVSARLAVESHNARVLVKVTIDNESAQTIYLPRTLMKDSAPEGNLFEVRDSSNGDPLDYTGMMVKRAPLGKKDYVAIKPHTHLSNTLDVSEAYKFVPGRHAYQINMSSEYVTDLNKLEETSKIEPVSAMFAHVGQ